MKKTLSSCLQKLSTLCYSNDFAEALQFPDGSCCIITANFSDAGSRELKQLTSGNSGKNKVNSLCNVREPWFYERVQRTRFENESPMGSIDEWPGEFPMGGLRRRVGLSSHSESSSDSIMKNHTDTITINLDETDDCDSGSDSTTTNNSNNHFSNTVY